MAEGPATSFPGDGDGDDLSASLSAAEEVRSCWIIFAPSTPMAVRSGRVYQLREVFSL